MNINLSEAEKMDLAMLLKRVPDALVATEFPDERRRTRLTLALNRLIAKLEDDGTSAEAQQDRLSADPFFRTGHRY